MGGRLSRRWQLRSMLGAGGLALACNAVLGLDDVRLAPNAAAGGAGSGGAATAGTAGNGGKGEAGLGGQSGEGGEGGMPGSATCGDGIVDGDERCDDHNTRSSDGCSATCRVEEGFDCGITQPSMCTAICGDGLLLGAELKPGGCDDGNTDPRDGCGSTCRVDAGYFCSNAPSRCFDTCGNGELDGDEECDDENGDPDDGCVACAVEPGWSCMDEPSTCMEVDDCDGDPCKHGGVCVDGVNRFTCNCSGTGYAGPTCEVSTDDCASDPCQHGGTCIDGDGDYTCQCSGTGYEGPDCATNTDDCTPDPCEHGGTCADEVNGYTCDCDGTGYYGSTCELAAVDCDPDPCEHGGVCVQGVGMVSCDCSGTGYEGTSCQSNVNDCSPNPCLNGGGCTDAVNDFSCDCSGTGYTGSTCGMDVDDCASNPCQHGGTCDDEVNGYSCDCTGTGYTGTDCQQNEDNCSPNPCQHGGTCTDGVNTFTCNCAGTGYGGTTCQNDVNECMQGTDNCNDHATCTNAVPGFTCMCEPGFTGNGVTCTQSSCTAPALQAYATWPMPHPPSLGIAPAQSYTNLLFGAENVVRDNVTGLMWIRDASTTGRTQAASKTYCEGLTYAGYCDWRLPSRIELASLLDETKWAQGTTTMMDTTAFPGAPATSFWTSSIRADNTGQAWSVEFATSGVIYRADTETWRARCVRGGITNAGQRYTAGTGGSANTVLDNMTGLRWQQVEAGLADYAGAATTCANATTGNFSDWRVPTLGELYTLVDETRTSPSIDPLFTNANADYVWTSLSFSTPSVVAFQVRFIYGHTFRTSLTPMNWVRCVR